MSATMNLSKFLLPPVACLASALLSAAATSVGSLRTEYLETPLGIDEPRPLFSWQMSSDRIGAAQTAYRVLVAEGEDALEEGVYVYDSGTVASRQSLTVPYRGRALEGMTRYFWKVLVTDDTGTVLESEPSWFETGLMNEGWSRAEWIGSEAVGVSRYRTFFNILYDVRIPEGSRSAVFAYGVKDEDKVLTAGLELGRNGGANFSVDYCVDGDMRHLATVDISDIVTPENAHETHSVELKVEEAPEVDPAPEPEPEEPGIDVPPWAWDDDDDYVPPIVPSQTEDSGDDDTVTIVACAAAAVVAALMAAFLILDRRH